MNQYDDHHLFENRPLIGCGRAVLSMKMGDFVDGNLFLRSPSRKMAVFLDETLFSRSVSKKLGVFLDGKSEMVTLSKKRGIFLDGKVADNKETPSKGCLRNCLVMRCPIRSGMTSLPVESYRHCQFAHIVIAGLTGNLLLIQRSSNVNSACNCTTYHGVVTDSEGYSCELCVRV